MGQRLISLKGESGSWRGKSTLNVNDRGERRLLKLENGYVSPDGAEIRHFPGFFTLLDLSDENNANGYSRITQDAVRPIYSTSPSEVYQYGYDENNTTRQTLNSFARPVHYHGFEQVGDTLVVWGESRFRESPIYAGVGAKTLAYCNAVAAINIFGAVRWRFDFTETLLANSASDFTGPGLNGIGAGNVVYIEGLQVSDATIQARLDAEVNGRIHAVKSITGASFYVNTVSAGAATATTSLTENVVVGKVRYNRNNNYPTPAAITPYITDLLERPDDPDALTSWRVIEPLDKSDVTKQCYPAWVANRQRDFGDRRRTNDTEGIYLNDSGSRGISRREQRKLPYRTNPECAADRIVLAAPGYGCMFQIPLKVPSNPDDWPASPDNGAYGIPYQGNDIYDKPRALGIPKARMIESIYTPAPDSPSIAEGVNFSAAIIAGSPDQGLTAGEYLVSVSYEDEALGEEGLASEPVTVVIPTSTSNYAYTLKVNYLHPGYVMPECLALKLNVYIAPPGQTAMAFYASFPLSENPKDGVVENDSSMSLSAEYGFAPVSPDIPAGIFRSIELPLLGTTNDVTSALDAERLAPQSASMPRGADACRYIRGVLLAGGNIGNTGGSLQLWQSYASVRFDPSATFENDDEFHIRVTGNELKVPASDMDGDITTSTFGTAGRTFPDAYQGMEAISNQLWPVGNVNQRVDRVVNRKSSTLTGANAFRIFYERVRTTKSIFNRTRQAGQPVTPDTTFLYDQPIYYVMPKGQLQVGDPGAPSRSSKAAIQFVDPNRGDDITAIGNLSGTAIICTRKETYTFAWSRNPGGEVPNVLSNEHGCIAANSMVEFDGGVAWIGERGPVAVGNGLQFIGLDVQEDFYGSNRRYLCDSRGMMRHAWGCHDAARGLVLWGMVSSDSTTTLTIEGEAGITFDAADDEGKSRFPCDEVLIWSYRTGSFSTWRPPAGLEVYWMRPVRDADGEVHVAFLAADGRIYALDDTSHDCIDSAIGEIEVSPTAKGSGTTLIVSGSFGVDGGASTGRGDGKMHLRAGQLVEMFDADDNLIGSTTVASVGTITASTATITLSASLTWLSTYTFRIGGRQRMTIVSSYVGGETMDTIDVECVQMRYSLHGKGFANAKVSVFKTDFDDNGPTPREVTFSDASSWDNLGSSVVTGYATEPEKYRVAHRRRFAKGRASAPEVAVKVVISGSSQTRISDIMLEVA